MKLDGRLFHVDSFFDVFTEVDITNSDNGVLSPRPSQFSTNPVASIPPPFSP